MPYKTLDLTGFLIKFRVIFFPNLRYLELIMTYVGHPAWHSFFFNQMSPTGFDPSDCIHNKQDVNI